jgi:hypothetical protein
MRLCFLEHQTGGNGLGHSAQGHGGFVSVPSGVSPIADAVHAALGVTSKDSNRSQAAPWQGQAGKSDGAGMEWLQGSHTMVPGNSRENLQAAAAGASSPRPRAASHTEAGPPEASATTIAPELRSAADSDDDSDASVERGGAQAGCAS